MTLFIAVAEPWTILVDITFVTLVSSAVGWYYHFYVRKEILGGFLGATFIAGLGSILFLTLTQKVFREIVMWLMSPKLGTVQISNVNLIVAFIGGYLSIFIVNRIRDRNRDRNLPR